MNTDKHGWKRVQVSWSGAFMLAAYVYLILGRPVSAVVALCGAVIAEWKPRKSPNV